MITLPELLEDKVYRKFFTTPVRLPPQHPLAAPQWRVHVQRESDGRWGHKDFRKYSQAFKFLKPYLKTCHDATIQSRGIAYDPPTRWVRVTRGGKPILIPDPHSGEMVPKIKKIDWIPKLPEGEDQHVWCPYCRRPTVFTWFSKHHAFGSSGTFDPSLRRCTICGSSERLVIWNARSN